MSGPPRQLRSLLSVALPVAIAAMLVCLAVVNIASVRTWRGEPEDGVLWAVDGTNGTNVVAKDVAIGSAGQRAGLLPGDVLLLIDGREVKNVREVQEAMHASADGRSLMYVITRQSAEQPISLTLQPMPLTQYGLYYSLAAVGIFSIVIGAAVRLRRPADQATLHFFWLSVAFFGAFVFHASGKFDRLDYFFWWSDVVARLALPPLFLHFALVFPDRPTPWVATDAGRAMVPAFYVPAFLLGGARVTLMLGGLHGPQSSQLLERIEQLEYAYLAVCLLGGLALMIRALSRLRSVTARRQLRWIVWGSSVGAVPFVLLYVLPYLIGRPIVYTEYTAVLLGCIPLAFASAIVRYRLMDIEVIIKKALVAAAVVLVLALIYSGVFWVVSMFAGTNPDSRFWALLATLVVALVYPWLWHAIQSALDRLYYRDRYDYRRALVSFARELNSDLDLERLSTRLVTRVRDTLAAERIALFLADPSEDQGDFIAVASLGLDATTHRIGRPSPLGGRLVAGHTVVIDDPMPVRRLTGEDAAEWRGTGLHYFVPCVSKEVTTGVLAVGRKALGEPLNSEDMTLLGAVASQAATALENARLYGQLRVKAEEIERLRQFSDSVVESLSDGLLVVDLDDRVMRWNRRLETLIGLERGRAVGRRLPAIFDKVFLDSVYAARRETPQGVTLYRVPLASTHGGQKRLLLVNAGIAPFQTAEGVKVGWIIVLEDITDRANLEEQLRLSEKMAAIGLLAAGVAHEVNTPLTGISSFTQMLLERSDPDDPRTQLLEKIERQTFRAAKIVNSLLNLARPSDGEAGPVDLNGVIGDVLSLLEHQFKTSRIQVRKELASPALIVRGVEYKLQQVFLNLFLNARDAMPKGGWLTVSARVDNGEAIVELSDTGVGIPAEHLARIYDPFFTTKPEGRGTGLGLSVTYGIVQEHGGTLSCESAPGQGTRFRLALPTVDRSPIEAALG
jgi:two-component system NtrC family sensor kinase